jgi:hypothetical protein
MQAKKAECYFGSLFASRRSREGGTQTSQVVGHWEGRLATRPRYQPIWKLAPARP